MSPDLKESVTGCLRRRTSKTRKKEDESGPTEGEIRRKPQRCESALGLDAYLGSSRVSHP